MKELSKIRPVSKQQRAFGARLGLDLADCTLRVALAKINDLIAKEFWGADLDRPTDKQIDLAAKFGYDISNETNGVGSAIIDDIMTQLNLESIEEQDLKPGDIVTNKWDKYAWEYTISSIQEDGTVFLKGRKRAWARNLVKGPRGNDG